jgi:KipI family sensor histidine kinase inhibitor
MQSAGDDLISISVDGPREAQSVARQLRASDTWLEVVAGIDSVVVKFDLATMDPATATEQITKASVEPFDEPETSARRFEIPVIYGGEYGPELASICEHLQLSEAEFIALHTASEYDVDMVGFTPGFAYIGGLDPRLDIPRLQEPRVHVEAGSVGMAGGRTGLYAMQGPGGWPLIGRTAFKLFQPDSDPPFTLQPGDKVRFIEARRR